MWAASTTIGEASDPTRLILGGSNGIELPAFVRAVIVARIYMVAIVVGTGRLCLVRQPEACQRYAGEAEAESLQRPAAGDGLGHSFGQFIESVVHNFLFLILAIEIKITITIKRGDDYSEVIPLFRGGLPWRRWRAFART